MKGFNESIKVSRQTTVVA